jgi:hypothetical protein
MFWGLPFTFALGILLADETRKLIVRTYPKVSHTAFLYCLRLSVDYSVLELLSQS